MRRADTPAGEDDFSGHRGLMLLPVHGEYDPSRSHAPSILSKNHPFHRRSTENVEFCCPSNSGGITSGIAPRRGSWIDGIDICPNTDIGPSHVCGVGLDAQIVQGTMPKCVRFRVLFGVGDLDGPRRPECAWVMGNFILTPEVFIRAMERL